MTREKVWPQVIREIPEEYYDKLVVMVGTGAELVLQGIIRMDDEFLIVRGRMAGSSDDGRVLVIPYGQITYLGFNKWMAEEEVKGIFGREPEEADADGAAAAVPAGSEAGANGAAPGKPPPGKASKSLFLAKLRQRLAGNAAGGNPTPAK
jgi:hypothetical protein